jgi:diguanylate cyclase (GGDEF)-like protein/hemerythrin-like metal-binding protein
MDAFQWNPCFLTGLPEVDEQHHRLVDAINRFGELVMREEGATATEMEAVFGELAAYARHHFAEEEAMMVSQRLDARFVERHQHSHNSFMEEVTRLHGSVTAGNTAAARALLGFLTHWLAYHILGSDQVMAKQIAAIQAGSSPAAASLTEPQSSDPATDTLLSALNSLFHQVSERNRELVELNASLEARVAERTQALTEANQRLEDLANTDLLTGLPNRRHAMRSFAHEWELAKNRESALACMMIDADRFKGVNDTHGHDAGDAVLRALSACLQHAVRTDDMVCRLGGDEFLIICAGTPLEGALKLGEKIRSEVAELKVAVGNGQWCASISVGVAARSPGMTGIDDLMKSADQGLYLAKQRGRNGVASVSV